MTSYVKQLIIPVLLCCVLALSAPLALAEEDLPVTRPPSKYIDLENEYPVDVYDPFEGFNRGVYRFNTDFDRYFFLPVVRGYEFITPKVARQGVTNFFSNLSEVRNFANSLLQGKAEGCVTSLMRFCLNSTIGIGGLFDPATDAGFNQKKEDFGQTLGVWGLNPGPFVMLPILGPSSVRDTGGLAVDSVGYSLWSGAVIREISEEESIRNAITYGMLALNAVNTRSNVKFRYWETGSPFEYDLVRFLYTKKREFEVAD